MPAPLYLHIGLQKTGTSYVQTILWGSTDELARQGVALVPDSKRRTFWLMLDVRNRVSPGEDPHEVASAVDRLPDQLAAIGDSIALVSQESLASANPEQAARLVAACRGREVHVIVTVRDLARQIPSAWQENIKAGDSTPLRRYVKTMRRSGRRSGGAWRQKDVPAVLRLWAEQVPPERIHVITVPPSGGAPELLLERFCGVVGLDASRLDPSLAGRANRGLGLAQAEVLRRVNKQLPDEVKRRALYGDVGKRLLAMQILNRSAGERVRLDADHREWCTEISQEFVDHIRVGGYDVVGDLDDLMPGDALFASGQSQPAKKDLLDVAVQAIADLLVHLVRERQRRGTSKLAQRRRVRRVLTALRPARR